MHQTTIILFFCSQKNKLHTCFTGLDLAIFTVLKKYAPIDFSGTLLIHCLLDIANITMHNYPTFKIMFIFFILPLLYETMHTIAPKDKHKHGNHHTGTPPHYLYSICLLVFFTTSWSWFALLLSKSIKSFITTHAMFSAFHECEKMVNHMMLMEWQMLIEDLTELLSDKCPIAATMTFIHIH